MQELIALFVQHGLTPEQANDAIQTITEWLKDEYPVAGVLLASWIKNQTAPHS
jgi:hypothetical protein